VTTPDPSRSETATCATCPWDAVFMLLYLQLLGICAAVYWSAHAHAKAGSVGAALCLVASFIAGNGALTGFVMSAVQVFRPARQRPQETP
jgi:hypothetical protein